MDIIFGAVKGVYGPQNTPMLCFLKVRFVSVLDATCWARQCHTNNILLIVHPIAKNQESTRRRPLSDGYFFARVDYKQDIVSVGNAKVDNGARQLKIMCCCRYRSAAAAATATPVLPPLLPLLTQRQQRRQHRRSSLQALGWWRCHHCWWCCFCFLFLFLFLLLHANGVVVSHLFLAMDIGVTASSVAAAVNLSAVVPWVETKMPSTTTTVVTTNETHHGMPSTLPSNPSPREGEGKGNEGKDGGHCCNSWW